jgi:hypothetical protein
MTAPRPVVVPPSIPRLLALLLVGGGGVVGGLLLIFGPGPVWSIVAAAVGGLVILAFVVAVARQRPRVVITPEGFTVYKLFGEESRNWDEVHRDFAVIKIGLTQAVGYNLTADYKARTGKRPTSLFSGYDAAISGAFALPAEKLAELLNAHARQRAGSADGGVRGEDREVEPS